MIRRFAFAIFAIAVAACSSAQALPTKRTFVAGAETAYALRMEMTLFGEQAVYTSTVVEKVTEVGPPSLVSLTQKDYKVMVFGEESTVNDSDMPKLSHRVAENGEVVEIQGDITLASSYRMAALRAVLLPTTAVEVGGKYAVEGKANKDKGLEDRLTEYVYEAVEEINGIKTARLTVSYKETSGANMATATGKAWIDLSNGQIAKLELDYVNAPVPGANDPVTGKLTYERATQ